LPCLFIMILVWQNACSDAPISAMQRIADLMIVFIKIGFVIFWNFL
jgi:hypothetical protein